MWVQGKVREAKVFGDKLELERKITTWMDQPRVILEDVVENIGSQTSPLMVLYHSYKYWLSGRRRGSYSS